MGFRKLVVSLIFLYFLSLLQYSFFPLFSINGVIPNLVLILVCLWNFFEKTDDNFGILLGIEAGFFLDVFSSNFFGTSIVLLLIISIIFKKAHRMLKESQEKHPFVYFLPLFIFCLIFYNLFLKLNAVFFLNSSLQFNLTFFLINLGYNMVLAIIGFYLFKIVISYKT